MKKQHAYIPISIDDFEELPQIAVTINLGAPRQNRRIIMDRYKNLFRKSVLLCNYFTQMIVHYETLKQGINVSITQKKALFDTQTDPVSRSIVNMITSPCIFSDQASHIALEQFGNKLITLVQRSVQYVCDEFEDRTLVQKLTQLEGKCRKEMEVFRAARDVINTFINEQLPYYDTVIDFDNLTAAHLSRFDEVLTAQMDLAKVSINRFNHLSARNNSHLNNLKKLNSCIATLGARFKGEDFSAFKSSYVKRASKYLAYGNGVLNLNGIIIEQSRVASNIANIFTLFSPHKFIKPSFNDGDENNKTKVLTLLRQAAVETIDVNNSCVIL